MRSPVNAARPLGFDSQKKLTVARLACLCSFKQEYVVDNPVEHRDEAHETKKCTRKSTKMKEGRVSLSHIQQELKTVRCCKVNCVSTVLKLPEILYARRDFQDMNREEQVQWLLNFFQLGQRVRNGRKTYEHSLQGKVICQKAWIFCHGMSYGR